jgi:hypothetical protein
MAVLADDPVKSAVVVYVDDHGVEAVVRDVREHAPEGVSFGLGGAVDLDHGWVQRCVCGLGLIVVPWWCCRSPTVTL